MKKFSMLLLFLILVFTFAVCSQPISRSSQNTESLASGSANAGQPGAEWTTESTAQINLSDESKVGDEDQMKQKKELILSINGNKMDVSWEDNDTVEELIDHIQNENIIVNTTLYGGFEQVGSLPRSFSRNDVPNDYCSWRYCVVFRGSACCVLRFKQLELHETWAYQSAC